MILYKHIIINIILWSEVKMQSQSEYKDIVVKQLKRNPKKDIMMSASPNDSTTLIMEVGKILYYMSVRLSICNVMYVTKIFNIFDIQNYLMIYCVI